MTAATSIFVLYAFEHKAVVDQILKSIKSLQTDFSIAIHNNDPIYKDQPWKPHNSIAIENSDIFLFLLSHNLFYSEFINQLEFKKIIDRYKAGEATVIPVILDHCPWDTNFEAEEYSFSFKELEVLPIGEKPLLEYDDEAPSYEQIRERIAAILGINTVPVKEVEEISNSEEPTIESEDQMTLDFSNTTTVEEANSEEKNIEESEQEINEFIAKEEELIQRAEIHKEEVAENQNKELKINERLVEARQQAEEEKEYYIEDPNKNAEKTNKKRRVFALLLFVTAIAAIWITLSKDEKSQNKIEEAKTPIVKDTTLPEEVQKEIVEKEDVLPKLVVGELYADGIVFEVKSSNQGGKVVHVDDVGPMTWNEAINIHEQLGEGWRLPTFDELKTLYKTVGQGATNRAEFADKLYWSATSYDTYQARLLHFRTGNTSYHYNKASENRKFLVRAVRDIKPNN